MIEMRKTILVLSLSLFAAACSSAPQDSASSTAGGANGLGGRNPGGPGAAPLSGVASSTLPGAGTAIPGSQQDLAQTVGDRVYFTTNQSELSPEARGILDRQAQWLQRYPAVTVTIEGHADERGTREYNLALGDRRASAVRNYLASLGIPTNRVATISYGKERPEVVGSNEKSWAQNRRAVTTVN